MTEPPTGTYRIQLTPEHTLRHVIEDVPRIAQLGVSHLYLSPVLASAPGSRHGYDVVDHRTVDSELGGLSALLGLSAAAKQHGLGIVLDVVPNHMAMPVPERLNAVLWAVLRDGSQSPFASWFDVDWSAQRPLLLPVLGDRIDACLEAGQITLGREGPDGAAVLHYEDHVFPVRPGTEDLPVEELLDMQHYRLAYWRLSDDELNYRRFFDVDTLVGLRVEDPDVFRATHELVASLVKDGVVSGLRIDHPDGLADPAAYLAQLAEVAGDPWVVVEKILEGDEQLPDAWRCDGTTGYDAAARIDAVFTDPAAEIVLTQAFCETVDDARGWDEIAHEARRQVLQGSLAAEVERLSAVAYDICQREVRLRDHSRRAITEALVEILATVPVYRVYVRPGIEPDAAAVEMLTGVAHRCAEALPDREPEIMLVRDLALGRHDGGDLTAEFVIRFQQTCGPAMAKGVEDTAFYRWFPLTSLAEVGMSPGQFAIPDEDIHGWARSRGRRWPAALTALTTHDSKRSEDVRSRIAVLSEIPSEWLSASRAWSAHAGPLELPDGVADPRTEWLLWQTVVGAWPITSDRLSEYMIKAVREAKLRTSWAAPDEAYETAIAEYVARVLGDDDLRKSIDQLVERLAPAFTANVLGKRALQLMLPGVPDIYQGCEVVNLRLTDPDNRSEPDADALRAALARSAVDGIQPASDLDAAKARLTSTGMRLRRDRPELSTASGDYTPLWATGPAADHSFGFTRHGVCVAVTRRALRLDAAGGWRETRLQLPEGRWRDAITGDVHDVEDGVAAEQVHAAWPATILVREQS